MRNVAVRRPVRGPVRRPARARRGMAVAVVAGAMAAALAAGSPARALAPSPRFAPYVTYDAGAARSVAVADFTGDGRNDVAVATESVETSAAPDHVHLLAQGPDGSLSRLDSIETDLGWQPQGGLDAGDVDGDGLADAVVATGRSVHLLLQRAGRLVSGPQIDLPGVRQVTVADVDGDGRADLTANGLGGVAVVLGLGGGTFAVPRTVSPEYQIEVEVGDVTGDGRADLVTCGYPNILVFAQEDGGSFATPVHHNGPVRCGGVAVADVDGDDRLDVSFGGGGNWPSSRLAVLSQRADGILSPPTTYPASDIPGAIEAGDMNGDGRTDLVLLHTAWLVAGVHAQAPDGTLDHQRSFAIPDIVARPGVLAIGDVTGDRRPDIVVAGDRHGVVVLAARPAGPSTTTSSLPLANTVPTTAPAASPAPLFSAHQAYDLHAAGESVTAGDFNGDGRTDVALSSEYKFDPATNYKLFVFYQGGDGSFERVVSFDTDSWSSDVMALGAGDLDGDGKTDLVLRTREGVNLFMQRSGAFVDRRYIQLPYASELAIADIDRDGMDDMVFSGSAGTQIYRSAGSGTFAPPLVVTTEHRTAHAVADVTGDGRVDVVGLNNVGPASVVVHRQLPDGTFATGDRVPAGGPAGTLALGDFTGDGRVDVAVTHGAAGTISIDYIRVLTQGEDGTLGAPLDLPAREPGPLLAGDVDGDGRTDLVALYEGSHAGVRLQQSNGRLGAEQSYPLPGRSLYRQGSAVLADFTGDRRLDIAVADFGQGLDVLRNVAPGIPPLPTQSGTFHPLTPARILDTRAGTGAAAAKVGPGGTLRLQVTGRGGVPATGVSAVVLNLTATEPTAVSFLTAWPTGEARPLASNLNVVPGQTVPNLVVAKVGLGGTVDLFNNAGSAHVVADVAGWYGTDVTVKAGRHRPITPARILDTRAGVGAPAAKVGPGGALDLQVTGRGGVPATGVSAVVLNLTATEPTAVSFLTVWPTGEPRPLASNLNVVPGQTVPNLVVAKVGANGRVALFNDAGSSHVVADVAGWFADEPSFTGGTYTAVTPNRLLDTRAGTGAAAAKVGPGGTVRLQVTGRGGVPATGVSAVVLNVTATEPTSVSFLTVWPGGEPRPLASSLNMVPGQTVPNLVAVKVGADGTVDLFNNAGSAHVVADVAGWYAG